MTNLELGKKRAEELGLEPTAGAKGFYRADDIHKLLGEGVEFVAIKLGDSNLTDQHRAGWSGHEPGVYPVALSTHKALLIGIRPIKQKTREEELEEVVREMLSCERQNGVGYISTTTFDKAKALLERK